MRIFTCTPVAFGGGPDFFARDSGLLCRGLQSIGVECHAVMPGERKPEDEGDLIRTEYANLESVDWWKRHHLDGVVLYAWGSPKFPQGGRAIHDAGVFLILNQDNGGLVSPLAGFGGWWEDQRNLSGGGREFWKRITKGLSYGLAVADPLRAMHLRCGDVIACVSPRASEHYRRLCRVYGGNNLSDRIHVLPHAVEPRFRFSGRPKKKQVVCVGRWNDKVQKRPCLLMDSIRRLISDDDLVRVVIAGQTSPELESWHKMLADPLRQRVELRGRTGRGELASLFDESQVFYSPSAFESFGIAAAEALCCGCSVVAEKSVSMSAFEWFVSEESGAMAEQCAGGHVAALRDEVAAWEKGARDGGRISTIWTERLHADKVAGQIVELVARFR